jgi:type IV pilus assembly protein PilM
MALLLPDASGRILLTETDLLPKSREEGLELLRWQLKGKFPVDAREVRLDYQLIGKGEGEKQRILVSMASVRVLDQYEELLDQAGFAAALICFHSLGLFSYYRARVAGGDFVLVAVEGGVWSLQLFLGGALVYHRSRELNPQPAVIFQETVRSLAGCRERFPALEQAPVCLHTDAQERQALADALRGAFGREVVDAGPALNSPGLSAALPGLGTASVLLAANIGAMERMIG